MQLDYRNCMKPRTVAHTWRMGGTYGSTHSPARVARVARSKGALSRASSKPGTLGRAPLVGGVTTEQVLVSDLPVAGGPVHYDLVKVRSGWGAVLRGAL